MGGSHGYHLVGKAAAHSHGCHEKAFRHGGTGAVKSQMGDIPVSQGKGGADALIQQVSGKYQVDFRLPDPGFPDQCFQGQLLHSFFGLLPGFLTEKGIFSCDVKGVLQGTLGLFLAGDTGPVGDSGRLRKQKTSYAPFVGSQSNTILSLALVCA